MDLYKEVLETADQDLVRKRLIFLWKSGKVLQRDIQEGTKVSKSTVWRFLVSGFNVEFKVLCRFLAYLIDVEAQLGRGETKKTI